MFVQIAISMELVRHAFKTSDSTCGLKSVGRRLLFVSCVASDHHAAAGGHCDILRRHAEQEGRWPGPHIAILQSDYLYMVRR